MNKVEYLFSVVMPLYNAEEYLEESVQCILDQSIGFKDTIQIVFVNDGSMDHTKEICDSFVRLWPDNIQYIEQENAGVSSARNRGIEAAEGKYVLFFDYDDLWEKDAFQIIHSFLKEHREADVATCKMQFIGDFENKIHPLDYKFKEGSRVADLLEEPGLVNSTIGNMVYKRSAIGACRFDPNLPTGEDATFTNTILLTNPKLGIISDAVFYYRRNFVNGSVSSSAPDRKTWYFEVPENYYLKLIAESKERYGETMPFIQEVILYDMRWRHFNEKMMPLLSDEEKDQHLHIMSQALQEIDDERIADYQIITQYRRLYYLYLKHGDQLLDEVVYEKGWALFRGVKILNYNAKSIFQIVTIREKNGNLLIDGYHRLNTLLSSVALHVKDDNGNEYPFEEYHYEKADQKGYIGEWINHGTGFHLCIPARSGLKIGFFIDLGDDEWQLKPEFWSESGLERNRRYTFCRKGSYILRYQKKWLYILPYNEKEYRHLKRRYLLSVIYRKNKKVYKRKKSILQLQRIKDHSIPKEQVAFVSARSNDRLLPNLKAVYDAWDGQKVSYSGMAPYSQSDLRKMAKTIYSSKVVVTDDYLYMLRLLGKRPDQRVIQIWHAAGAFKRFGKDGTNMFPSIDASYHIDYDMVSVSSDSIRDVYANAFCLPTENVKALGVPRTDLMFLPEHMDQVKQGIYERYSVFKGKQIILYAPTFRDGEGQNKHVFCPEIDFDCLSKSLLKEQIFVICPHPVMQNDIVDKSYDNIFVIRDISTNDMMYIADLLITDYSSVIFEYAILRKPMAFYCYDYDAYNRDFYLDYEKDLPGILIQREEDLYSYLGQDHFETDERTDRFYEKYMGACDGNSAKRIVDAIRKYM